MAVLLSHLGLILPHSVLLRRTVHSVKMKRTKRNQRNYLTILFTLADPPLLRKLRPDGGVKAGATKQWTAVNVSLDVGR